MKIVSFEVKSFDSGVAVIFKAMDDTRNITFSQVLNGNDNTDVELLENLTKYMRVKIEGRDK